MFPFTLDGPRFLVFYALLAAGLAIALRLRGRAGPEGAATLRIDSLAQDPYQVACLRGGAAEAVRVAVVNLVDRGLLVHTVGQRLGVTVEGSEDLPRRDLDRAILRCCRAAPMTPQEIAADRGVSAVVRALEAQLQRQGLRRTEAQRATDRWLRLAALAILAGVAGARIVQALSHGRTNIEYLFMLAFVAGLVVHRTPSEQLTRQGRRMMAGLQALMRRLRDRADRLAPGGATNEAALLAAVFGIHALPVTAFAFAEKVYPKPRAAQGGGGRTSDSSCSSSCSSSSNCSSSSSCSSDGGSSCGGGSGCGGCGSSD